MSTHTEFENNTTHPVEPHKTSGSSPPPSTNPCRDALAWYRARAQQWLGGGEGSVHARLATARALIRELELFIREHEEEMLMLIARYCRGRIDGLLVLDRTSEPDASPRGLLEEAASDIETLRRVLFPGGTSERLPASEPTARHRLGQLAYRLGVLLDSTMPTAEPEVPTRLAVFADVGVSVPFPKP